MHEDFLAASIVHAIRGFPAVIRIFFRGIPFDPPRAGIRPRITGAARSERVEGIGSLTIPDLSCRNTGPDFIGWNVFRHDRPRTDDGAIANRDSLQNSNTGSQPAIPTDRHGLDNRSLIHDKIALRRAVALVVNLAIGPELREIPNPNASFRRDNGVPPDPNIFPEVDRGLGLCQLKKRIGIDRTEILNDQLRVVRQTEIDVRPDDDVLAQIDVFPKGYSHRSELIEKRAMMSTGRILKL
jgi:hypothetical protein